MKRYGFPVLFVLLSLAAARTPASAQWSVDPEKNTPVCLVPDAQTFPVSVSDGSGGVIVAWQDYRGSDVDVYAQRLDASGVKQWTQYSAAVVTATGNQLDLDIIPDGSGGAIIAWEDARTDFDAGDDTVVVYVQRINSSGSPVWTTNGVAVSAATGMASDPSIVSDGSGGVIVAWGNVPAGSSTSSILIQRVSSAGSPQWTAGGVTLGFGRWPDVASDGSAGAIVGWVQSNASTDIYARRVNSLGTAMWTSGGTAICNESSDQQEVQIVSDGSGGAILAWEDDRNGPSNTDIYAQRVSSSGTRLWTSLGQAICNATYYQFEPHLVHDGTGGAVIGWGDARDMANVKLVLQRIDGAGSLQWTPDGMFICPEDGQQDPFSIVDDGEGGFIIAWVDFRLCPGPVCSDIYAQRIDTSGNIAWGSPGIPISRTTDTEQSEPSVVSDGAGGAIVVWEDERSGVDDIYAQNIGHNGYLADAAPAMIDVQDVANDQGGELLLMWTRSGWDVYPESTVDNYRIWRGAKPESLEPGSVALDATEYAARTRDGKLPSNAYLALATSSAGDTIYWQAVGTVNARWHTGYSYEIATPADSGEAGTPWHYFMVTANSPNPLVFWDSAPDSGYSVDNVAPEAVTSLSVEVSAASPATQAADPAIVAATVTARWNGNDADPDLARYELHRSQAQGFTPGPGTLIAQTSDTALVDPAPPAGVTSYYRVLSVDIHGNRSLPSPEASAGITVGTGYAVGDKWNLVSLALGVGDNQKTSLFPTAQSAAYAYADGYVQSNAIQNGRGYWVKFNGDQNVMINGLLIERDTIHLVTGWNLVGSVSAAVAVNQIGSNPAGLVTSQFFGYADGYGASASIEPGKGYWVKASQSGDIYLGDEAAAGPKTAGTISIVPTAETPPPPPDGPSGLTVGIPGEYALGQNFPNPFNPTTKIGYALPAEGHVLLRVFNMLGEVVVTLVDSRQGAAFHEVEFDAGQLASGIYYYRLETEGYTAAKRMLLVR